MHELSLVDSIVSDISGLAQKESFRKVNRLRLEIGSLSGVVPESIEFCFSELSRGSPLDGAELILKKVSLKVRCESCATESEPEIYDIQCHQCNSRDVTIIAGKDFKIIDLEVE